MFQSVAWTASIQPFTKPWRNARLSLTFRHALHLLRCNAWFASRPRRTTIERRNCHCVHWLGDFICAHWLGDDFICVQWLGDLICADWLGDDIICAHWLGDFICARLLNDFICADWPIGDDLICKFTDRLCDDWQGLVDWWAGCIYLLSLKPGRFSENQSWLYYFRWLLRSPFLFAWFMDTFELWWYSINKHTWFATWFNIKFIKYWCFNLLVFFTGCSEASFFLLSWRIRFRFGVTSSISRLGSPHGSTSSSSSVGELLCLVFSLLPRTLGFFDDAGFLATDLCFFVNFCFFIRSTSANLSCDSTEINDSARVRLTRTLFSVAAGVTCCRWDRSARSMPLLGVSKSGEDDCCVMDSSALLEVGVKSLVILLDAGLESFVGACYRTTDVAILSRFNGYMPHDANPLHSKKLRLQPVSLTKMGIVFYRRSHNGTDHNKIEGISAMQL